MFLIGGRTVKERVTRKRGERTCPTYIQYQFHRGHTIPVNAWGAIRYRYKSPLLFLKGSSKSGAFTQADYLAQVLAPHIEGFISDFAKITHTLSPIIEPLFIEDGNSAHSHKSIRNCCIRWRTAYRIILMPHPSTSPDINPIEKCWRWIKQRLHRREHQPTNEEEMETAVREEWDVILQEWINSLIDK
jgi:transposase